MAAPWRESLARASGEALSGLTGDLRYALRALAKAPGFATVAILSLALGIGASGAAFSFIDAIRFQSLPYPNGDRVVALGEGTSNSPETTWCCARYETYGRWKTALRSVDLVSGHRHTTAQLLAQDGEPPKAVSGEAVSEDLFRLLGVRPQLGRLFRPEEDRAGSAPVILISHDLWRSRFHGDAGVLGRLLKTADGFPTIVGVMPPGFKYEIFSDFWVPLAPLIDGQRRSWAARPDAVDTSVGVIARISKGSTLRQVRAELAATALAPAADGGRFVAYVRPLRQQLLRFWSSYDLFFGLVAIAVLLIACSNLAGLLLVRTINRQRELAVRTALGAAPSRVMRQLLTEGLLLAVAAGAVGTLLSVWLIQAIHASRLTMGMSQVFESQFDLRALAISLLLTFSAGFCVSILPARRIARADLQRVLRESAQNASSGAGKNRAQRVFVIAQIASAAMLLALAGRATRAYLKFNALDVGFDYQHVVDAQFFLPEIPSPPGKENRAPSASLASYVRIREALLAIPGVESVGAQFRAVAGRSMASGERAGVALDRAGASPLMGVPAFAVDPGFFAALRVPLLRGRPFAADNGASEPAVAIVNELAARQWWPGEDAVGKRFRFGGSASPWLTVIGVSGNTKEIDPVAVAEGFRPIVFVPLSQAAHQPRDAVEMFLRSRVPDTASLVAPVREALRRLAPDSDLSVTTQREIYREVLDPIRTNALSIFALAFYGLLLAAIGVYGVIAYTVERRTREIGIRVALGAGRSSILGLVLSEGVVLALLGISVGLAGFYAAIGALRNVIYDAEALDPWTFLAVGAVFLLVTLLASALPARRAARVDPIVALRSE